MNNDLIQQQFGANAAAYMDSPVHARGASLARLVELLQPQPAWQVLDVATGAGHMAFAVAPHVSEVTATDITSQMLQVTQEQAAARGLGNVRTATAEAHDLPYPDSSFDLVTCRIAAHHFAAVPLFVQEAARVLRPGGILAVVDNIVPPGAVGHYVNAFEKLRDPSHGRCLTLEEWTALFASSGLTVANTETLAKRLNFDFWAQRHDLTMQSYLRALLLESNRAVATFLDPQGDGEELTFRLLEAIVTGLKASPQS